jgi:hypothetical protein
LQGCGGVNMGINTHYYTVYGVHIKNYDNELSEELYGEGDKYEVVESSTDLDILLDGMSGEYMIFGKILFDSGDLRWNDFKDTFVEVDMSKLTDIRLGATQEMQKLLPNFAHYLDNEWKIMTFMHLS